MIFYIAVNGIKTYIAVHLNAQKFDQAFINPAN